MSTTKTSTTTLGEWLSTRTAAARLGIHPDHLRRLRRIGGGPPFSRVGRVVRYAAADVEGWMRARLADSTAAEAVAEAGR